MCNNEGLALGVVVGLLPLLLFVKMMDSFVPKRYANDRIIDSTAVEVDDDEN